MTHKEINEAVYGVEQSMTDKASQDLHRQHSVLMQIRQLKAEMNPKEEYVCMNRTGGITNKAILNLEHKTVHVIESTNGTVTILDKTLHRDTVLTTHVNIKDFKKCWKFTKPMRAKLSKRSKYEVKIGQDKDAVLLTAQLAFIHCKPKDSKKYFMTYLSLLQPDISSIASHYCTKYNAWGADLQGDFTQAINLSLINCISGQDIAGSKALIRYKELNKALEKPFSLLGFLRHTTTKVMIAEVKKYKGDSVSLAVVTDERDRRQDYDTLLGIRIRESFSELMSYEKSALQAYLDDKENCRPTRVKLLGDVASGIVKINNYIGYSKMSLLDNLETFNQANESHHDSLPELRQGRHKGDKSERVAHSHKGIITSYDMLIKAGSECIPN